MSVRLISIPLCTLCFAACSNDTDTAAPGNGSTTPDAGNAGGGDAATGSEGGNGETSICEEGCVATLAAACPNGPEDQQGCVSQCEQLRAGDCGAQYRAFQACAEGETLGCDPVSGIPVVEACSAEQDAFITCING